MSSLSKIVSTQLAWGQFVRSTLSSHGDKVAQRLHDTLHKSTPIYEFGKVCARFRAYDILIALANQELEHAEEYYLLEQNDDPDVRDACDLARARVDSTLDRLRKTCAGIFEVSSLATFGLKDKPPRESKALVLYVQHVISTLHKHGSIQDAFAREVSLTPFADALAVPTAELSTALAQIEAQTQEWQHALCLRHNAQTRWKQVYRHVAGILASEFECAGYIHLSAQLRPTIRRASGIEDPNDPDISEIDES